MGILTTRVLTPRDSYNQGFLQPGVLQPGVLTTLTTGDSYNQRVLTPRGSYNQGSYNQGFLQPAVLHPRFLQPGLLTTVGS